MVSCSPVHCWVKERSLHFWREGNHRGDLQTGNALTLGFGSCPTAPPWTCWPVSCAGGWGSLTVHTCRALALGPPPPRPSSKQNDFWILPLGNHEEVSCALKRGVWGSWTGCFWFGELRRVTGVASGVTRPVGWSRSLGCSAVAGEPFLGGSLGQACPLSPQSVGYRMTALQNSHPVLKLYFSVNKQKQQIIV